MEDVELRSALHSFIHSNFISKILSHYNDIHYLENDDAEVVQLINVFPFKNLVINETL